MKQVLAFLCLPHPPDQHLILGAEEGIFILNRNDQDATLEMVRDSTQGGLRGGAGAGLAGVLQEPSPLFSAALSQPNYLGVFYQQCPHVSLRSGCGEGGEGGGQNLRGQGAGGYELDGHS